MTDFTYRIDRRPDGTVVEMCGEAPNLCAARVREALAALQTGQVGPVVIDLHDLRFMASAAIAELLAFRLRLSEQGRSLRLASPRPDVAGLLVTTHLADLLPMYNSADEALADGV